MIVPVTHVTMASVKMALIAMTVFANLDSLVRPSKHKKHSFALKISPHWKC